MYACGKEVEFGLDRFRKTLARKENPKYEEDSYSMESPLGEWHPKRLCECLMSKCFFLQFEPDPNPKHPRSLTYSSMQSTDFNQVPVIVKLLISELDKRLPPLCLLCHTMTQKTAQKAESILYTMLHRREFGCAYVRRQLEDALPSVLAAMLQLFLRRLEAPPFLASSELCRLITEEGYKVTPRIGVSHGVFYNDKEKAIKACLRDHQPVQAATFAYIIEHFQKWCEGEVAYRLRRGNPTTNQEDIMNQVTELLGRLFGGCLVGINTFYVSARILEGKEPNLVTLKRNVLCFCIGFVPKRVWHTASLAEIRKSPEEGPQTAEKTDSCQPIAVNRAWNLNPDIWI